MKTSPATITQGNRARQTIWRLFRHQRMSANAATARLLAVDLAVHSRMVHDALRPTVQREDEAEHAAEVRPLTPGNP
jgi:hypothetical protein